MNLLQVKGFNHQVDLTTGILEEACSQMLSEFFRKLRQEKQGKTAENLPEEKQEKAEGNLLRQQERTDR